MLELYIFMKFMHLIDDHYAIASSQYKCSKSVSISASVCKHIYQVLYKLMSFFN